VNNKINSKTDQARAAVGSTSQDVNGADAEQRPISFKVLIALLMLPLVAIAVFAMHDTAEVRKAQSEIDAYRTVATNSLGHSRPQPDVDMEMKQFHKCGDQNTTPGKGLSSEWRECALQHMGKMKTYLVAILFARASLDVLAKHPDDEALKNEALLAIRNAADDLEVAKEMMMLKDKLDDACMQSVFCRLRTWNWEKAQSGTMYDAYSRILDETEYQIKHPTLPQPEHWKNAGRREFTQ
jgi:hypothetical protein